MASSPQEGNNNDLVVVESSPTGRYVRYNKILGKGMAKKVYLGFDKDDGIEVAWSTTNLTEETLKNKKQLESFCAEACLLKSLQHESIVQCYDSWIDEHNKIIHMITEFFTSGNLERYLRKYVKLADYKTIKNWARQILQALHYLHCHSPPICHCDIKCDNIFVNGNTGRVKLGDFGLSMILDEESSEQNDVTTKKRLDIYNFGLCIFQMIFFGVKSAELNKVSDPEIDKFIKKCMAPASEVPSAFDLLNDPVLAPCVSDTLTASSSLIPLRETVANHVARLLRSDFTLQGKEDSVSISMLICISFLRKVKMVKFVEFLLDTDTTAAFVEKMATYDGLSTGEVTLVSELMDKLITALKSSDNLQQTLEISSEQREIRSF